ncbi:hypothetical protein P7K49_020471 [Saguinus oedipus]|uniref:Uncharacterized protein n=1 Tax=Saguinus oedipus TaxID=9490 RepID=A0ABQ9V195_SAGOE|nr:hypothetical protein P7K49_020471 [Saguinus oedipus]
MVSGGACRPPPPRPPRARARLQKAAGRSAPAACPGPAPPRAPGLGEGARADGRAEREPGHLRQAGAAAAAQVRSLLSPTWRGGGGGPEAAGAGAGRLERWAAPAAALGSREGARGRPQKPFRFVQRLPARRGRDAGGGGESASSIVQTPSGPPPPSPPRAPWPAPRRSPPAPARPAARSRLPGPAPSSLRSLQSASRLNLALWAAWSESSRRPGKMGASAGSQRPGARGAHVPPRSARRPGRGLGPEMFLARAVGPGPRLPFHTGSSCLFYEGSRCFCSLHGGEEDSAAAAARGFRSPVSVRPAWPGRHLGDRTSPRPRPGLLGIGPWARPEAPEDR